ncbi:hypothetical protein G7046_g576 [Stylonectria norvegica]|nr:hypothetical protein G7046_g576 [Stylonectria norvegica]
MLPNESCCKVLPKELMIGQLSQIDLLMAMYQLDSAISVDSESLQLLETLRDWCESETDPDPQITETAQINMLLCLGIPNGDEKSLDGTKTLQIALYIPLTQEREDIAATYDTEPPPIKARVHQPAWMNRAEVARLNTEIPSQDILSIIEHIQEAASQHLVLADFRKSESNSSPLATDAEIVRVWFYFPSISTRSKRDDIVHYAPTYGLTGFLLAGKPGVLCLEGGSEPIDQFMKFIKTESWGDIPSQHKKVSERHREKIEESKRAFKDMQEITDVLGERRGERGNRNDMKALEVWLNNCGLGEALKKVIIQT